MKRITRHFITASMLAIGTISLTQCATGPVTKMNASGVNPQRLAAEARTALDDLYARNATARRMGPKAKGILVFPHITKGGFMIGGMGGNGALIRQDGTIQDFFQTGGISYGLQAGIQEYGYALFLMDSSSIANINSKQGWEVGSSPSLVVVNEGIASSLSTTTLNKGTYAYFFNQRGLMGGLGLQGSKITRIHPPKL